MSEQPAPGMAVGVNYLGFIDNPVLNAQGRITFSGFLEGPGIDGTNNNGIWSDVGGTLAPVVQSADPAAGTEPGVVHNGFLNGTLHQAGGHLIFQGRLEGPGVEFANMVGFWTRHDGPATLVGRWGRQAIGMPTGVLHYVFYNPKLNNSGHIAFHGLLTGTGVDSTNDQAVWSGVAGSITPIARKGEAAVGTPTDVLYGDFGSVMLNGLGQTTILGSLSGAGVDATNDTAIWSESVGSMSMVARTGEAAHGTVPGVVYSSLEQPVINDAGQMAYAGTVSGPGVDYENDEAIWAGSAGSMSLFIREGDAAPGAEPGYLFGTPALAHSIGNPYINEVGQIAFRAPIYKPSIHLDDEIGIWSNGTGSLEMVALSRGHAPGTEPEAFFYRDTFNEDVFSEPVLNGAGQVAFWATLGGVGINDDNNSGVWATKPDGELVLIAREGNLFDVDDDPLVEDLRTISNVRFDTPSGGQDGQSTSFSDAGELAFRLEFTDGGYGIFVASVGGLPGDLDGDGFVGITDLSLVLGAWNQSVPPGNEASDPSGDGFVGIEDLNIVLGHWNDGTPPIGPASRATIPEPMTVTVMLMLGSSLIVYRHR